MKILYVTTISDTLNAFLVEHIRMLIEKGNRVDIACNIEQPVSKDLFELGCQINEVSFRRSPINKDNYKAYKNLKKLIIEEHYDIVHTHTPVASAITRLSCKNIKITKIYYTAHGFHFHKGAPLLSWLIYYPIEKWFAKYTDTLITINNEDYERAKKKFKPNKIIYIPGVGLNVNKLYEVIIEKKSKREELNLPIKGFLILSVGELNKNKNHETIIRAIAELDNSNIHYVICGKGPLESYLKNLSIELGIENNVHLLGFREDIPEICKSCDIFAFPSYREGQGIAALEAMACGLPIVTSNVHGIVDYSLDGKTGYSCSPSDISSFSKHIMNLYNDLDKRNEMANYNIKLVEKFNLSNVLRLLEEIYN